CWPRGRPWPWCAVCGRRPSCMRWGGCRPGSSTARSWPRARSSVPLLAARQPRRTTRGSAPNRARGPEPHRGPHVARTPGGRRLLTAECYKVSLVRARRGMGREPERVRWMDEREVEMLELLRGEEARFRAMHPGFDAIEARINAPAMANRRFVARALGDVL